MDGGEKGKNQWTEKYNNRNYPIRTTERKQAEKKNEQSLRDLWDYNKRSNIYIGHAKLNNKKIQLENGQKIWRVISVKKYTDANQAHERCLTSSARRKKGTVYWGLMWQVLYEASVGNAQILGQGSFFQGLHSPPGQGKSQIKIFYVKIESGKGPTREKINPLGFRVSSKPVPRKMLCHGWHLTWRMSRFGARGNVGEDISDGKRIRSKPWN